MGQSPRRRHDDTEWDPSDPLVVRKTFPKCCLLWICAAAAVPARPYTGRASGHANANATHEHRT
eukprot:9397266-Pyramimonas_sp.AAC.1